MKIYVSLWLIPAALVTVSLLIHSGCASNLSVGNDGASDASIEYQDAATTSLNRNRDRDDLCAAASACFVYDGGDYQSVSTETMSGYKTTVITDTDEWYRVLWEVSSISVSFTLELPEGELIGPIDIGPVATDVEGTATGGLYIVRSFESALADNGVAKASELESIGVVRSYLYNGSFTGANPTNSGNHAGCDGILQVFSCTNRGICCDAHDACITEYCGNGRGTGHVGITLLYYYMLEYSADNEATLDQLISEDCQVCHRAAVACFIDSERAPQIPSGPSSCCGQKSINPRKKNSCGDPQECMIDGGVIVDPCICADHSPPIVSANSCNKDAGSDAEAGTDTDSSVEAGLDSATDSGLLRDAEILQGTEYPVVVTQYQRTVASDNSGPMQPGPWEIVNTINVTLLAASFPLSFVAVEEDSNRTVVSLNGGLENSLMVWLELDQMNVAVSARQAGSILPIVPSWGRESVTPFDYRDTTEYSAEDYPVEPYVSVTFESLEAVSFFGVARGSIDGRLIARNSLPISDDAYIDYIDVAEIDDLLFELNVMVEPSLSFPTD